MRSLLVRWGALALAVLLAGCGQGAALDRLAPGEHGKVAEVRSGDVLVLDTGLVVRLAGLQAPWVGDAGADEARDALARMVQGRSVQLYYGGARRDPAGRALAQARVVGGGWVEGQMLVAGEAQARTFADNRALARLMLDDEARARMARRGLWRVGGPFQVLLPQEALRAEPGFQIVEGRIAQVTQTGRGTWLDFAAGRDGFAAEVKPQALADLRAAGLDPVKLQGRLVRVRGRMEGDGRIQIDHPEQVEVVESR